MAEVPRDDSEESATETITEGYFEEEFSVDAADAGEFLIELGEQLRDGSELTLTGEDWELPFAFGGPVTLEVEFEGDGDPELEIEVELDGLTEDETPELS